MAHREASAFANLLIRKVFIKLQPHNVATSLIQRCEAQADQAGALPANNLLVGEWLRVGGVCRAVCPAFRLPFQRHNLPRLAAMIDCQVMDGAIEPTSWFPYRVKL